MKTFLFLLRDFASNKQSNRKKIILAYVLVGVLSSGVLSVAACSIIGDPSVHKNWDYKQFNIFETFADVPNEQYLNALPDSLRQQCAPDLQAHAPELTIAATQVRWDMNSQCRNEFEDGRCCTTDASPGGGSLHSSE